MRRCPRGRPSGVPKPRLHLLLGRLARPPHDRADLLQVLYFDAAVLEDAVVDGDDLPFVVAGGVQELERLGLSTSRHPCIGFLAVEDADLAVVELSEEVA